MKGIDGSFDVVGARGALAFFKTVEPGKLAHGYIFTGPNGVGKKTFARRLAQSLLCETPKATLLGYCGHCVGCKLLVAGTHPDFVAAEGTIKIGKDAASSGGDEMTARELVRELSLHGYRSAYRVVLLGDVEFATHEAANALLKFLEEPPAGVIVVLTTSAIGKLLPTVRSRLVEISFGPLTAAEVESVLVVQGVLPEKARLAAEVSLGSVTRARAVLDDDESGVREAAFEWFGDALSGRTPDHAFLRLDDRGRSAGEKRAAVRELIEVVRIAARDWAALALAGEDVVLLAADKRASIERLPKRAPAGQLEVLAALGEAERLANTNVSAGLVVDFLRMALAPQRPPG